MIGRLANVLLLALLPIALSAPLAVSEVSFWFYSVREEISIFGSLIALYETGDQLLFWLILVLSVIGPYLRLLLMTYAAFSTTAAALKVKPLLDLVGRFSLIDVIVISLLVISFRVPEFKLQWGFYLVLGLWAADMIASWSVWRRMQTIERPEPVAAAAPAPIPAPVRPEPPRPFGAAEVSSAAEASPPARARRRAAFERPGRSSARG